MAPINLLRRIPLLYHFTDRRNVPLIKQTGGLYSWVELASRGVNVPAPGGNRWSRDADQISGVDNYIHLCFRANHPMEFAARQDGRIGDTIFLEIQPQVIELDGVRFAPDVANKSGVETYTISEASTMIDYDVLYTWTDWSDPEIQQRLRQAEKCEVLVPNHIPLRYIRNI